MAKKPEETLSFNPFTKFSSEWALLTAGRKGAFNTMTISWGGMGVLWGKNIVFCVVRPVRHTYKFMEKEKFFTLSFFGKEYRKALGICGAISGRDKDKVKMSGLHPVFLGSSRVAFREAEQVFVCKKIYFKDLDPRNFLDPSIEGNYPEKDYHRLYIGEITGYTQKKGRK
jgi:flavin reductase (DIM6/NTAB) family NADH-FMN oxidoreductase RutF